MLDLCEIAERCVKIANGAHADLLPALGGGGAGGLNARDSSPEIELLSGFAKQEYETKNSGRSA